MTAETIHTCSYSCDRPECIRAQRDELAARLTTETSNARGEWVLVPRNPTEEMLDAMHSRVRIRCDLAARTASIQNDREVWAAMLAAAPPAPVSVSLDRLTALDGLVDRIAEAIRDGGGLAEGDPPWERLGEERRAPWRADAMRVLAVVKESLTAETRTTPPADAEPKTLPVPTRVHLIGETAVIVGTPERGWDEDAQDAHNCDAMGCATIGPHVLARVPFTDERALASAQQQGLTEAWQDEWRSAVAAKLSSYGLSEEAAAVFAESELGEYRAGLCDCAENDPADMVDLMMGVALDAIEKWKVESAGRPFGYKRTAPPSAPVGVEGLLADLETIWHSVSDDKETNAAYQRLKSALAQQPAAVDDLSAWRAAFVAERAARYREGGMAIEQARIHAETDAARMDREAGQQPAAVDEAAAICAFEEHFQASSDDPYFEGELELWLTAWRKALATQQQGGAK